MFVNDIAFFITNPDFGVADLTAESNNTQATD